MRDILIDEPSTNDIAGAIACYDVQRSGLGLNSSKPSIHFLLRIAEHPQLYPAIRRRTHKALMSRFPHAVYYQFDDLQLRIVAVMHAKRSTRILARRLKSKPENSN